MVSINSHLKVIIAKSDRQYLDLVNSIESFSEPLEVSRDVILPAIEKRIRSLKYDEMSEGRAEKLTGDIEDDLKLVGEIVRTMQKRTNDLMHRIESLEIFANSVFTYSYGDAGVNLYQAMEVRKNRREKQ